jgi:hypothetical protein
VIDLVCLSIGGPDPIVVTMVALPPSRGSLAGKVAESGIFPGKHDLLDHVPYVIQTEGGRSPH